MEKIVEAYFNWCGDHPLIILGIFGFMVGASWASAEIRDERKTKALERIANKIK